MARVRVVLEGKRSDSPASQAGFYLHPADPRQIASFVSHEHVVSVEEIKLKPKPEDLPVGTVFRVKSGSIAGVKFVVAPGRYYSMGYNYGEDTFKLQWIHDDIEIIYLPKE